MGRRLVLLTRVDECPHLINLLLVAARGYRDLAARARLLTGVGRGARLTGGGRGARLTGGGRGLDEHGHGALLRRWEGQRDGPAESAAQFFVLRWGRWRGGVFGVRPREWAWLWRAHLLLAGCVGDDGGHVRRRVLPPSTAPSRVPPVHLDVADLQAAALLRVARPPVEDAQAEVLDVDV